MSDWTQIGIADVAPLWQQVRMNGSQPASALVRRACEKNVPIRVRIERGTAKKLALAAHALHFRWNAAGCLLDLFAGTLLALALDPATPKRSLKARYGRLSVATIREIRKSPEKLAWLAVSHGVSVSLIEKIRKRQKYRWVK